MALSMYQSSIPMLKRMLGSLAAILDKAVAHAEAKKIDPAVLFGARLFPDMFPLSRQVQIATDQAKGCAARLAGVEVPKYEDNEANFAELQARLAKTIAFLDSLTPAQIDGSEGKDIVVQVLPGREVLRILRAGEVFQALHSAALWRYFAEFGLPG
jgi:hypothetical protein